jgi:hypothetical protein
MRAATLIIDLLIAGDQGDVGADDATGADYGAAAALASDFLAELSELFVVLSELDFVSDLEDDEADAVESALDFFDDELRLSVL